MRGAQSFYIRARIGDEGGPLIAVNGRTAWALDQLMAAGERGLTPVSRPAPRWSHYVLCLRRAGVIIETVDEPHAGAFAGTHARYVLRSPVRVIERSGVAAPPPPPVPAGAPLDYGRRA
ncbi:hypothetical protein [Ancylobacter sp. TS-1]|uniref:winged helix domain-containing protein n=1 Tax=Ancylobacter sp. TS-1 TaxID=1850374 RepID=UPI001265B09D|nr:hypothetical protein [Ancylobacter sp. TS-1]QFR34707.1 hypothetical protein GBB76_17245 [Ancylobacter sp. TS-1]